MNLKQEFSEKFLVEDEQGVHFDWSMDFIQRIGAWFDEQQVKINNLIDRIITLEDENGKLKKEIKEWEDDKNVK